MRFSEANRQHQGILADLVELLTNLLAPFRGSQESPEEWDTMLTLMYPYVEDARWESAGLARSVYDTERRKHLGETANAWRAGYEFEWFREAMEPARVVFSQEGSPDYAVSRVVMNAAKVVEDGWRRTLIDAVRDDPANHEPRPTGSRSPSRQAVGWARVATGRETCEFCLTMISRGPVYLSAESAGLRTNDDEAAALWRRLQGTGEDAQLADEELDGLMTRWHVNCDCRVVPVFDEDNWPGKAEADKALAIWNRYTKLVEDNPELMFPNNGNQNVSGRRHWTKNEAIFAAIRRDLESGKISMADLAAAA